MQNLVFEHWGTCCLQQQPRVDTARAGYYESLEGVSKVTNLVCLEEVSVALLGRGKLVLVHGVVQFRFCRPENKEAEDENKTKSVERGTEKTK